jgi:hypothetical protein
MPGLISLLITLLILGVVFYVVVWLIDWIAVPEPFNKVIKIVVALIFILYLLSVVFGYAPHPVLWRE